VFNIARFWSESCTTNLERNLGYYISIYPQRPSIIPCYLLLSLEQSKNSLANSAINISLLHKPSIVLFPFSLRIRQFDIERPQELGKELVQLNQRHILSDANASAGTELEHISIHHCGIRTEPAIRIEILSIIPKYGCLIV
jgi:hypothetical protein